MKNPAIMTMTMFFRLLYMYKLDHDVEELAEGYDEMLDLTADAGFTSVDVTSWEIGILGVEKVAEALGKRGLSVSSVIHPDAFAAPDQEGFSGRVDKACKLLMAAEALHCPVFMLVPLAHPGIDTESREEIHKNLIRHLSAVTEHAVQEGLTVVIEDTPDLKLHLCTAGDVAEVLDAVPGLQLAYDSANMTLVGEDPVEYIRKFAGRIGYVHLKDYREAPAGSVLVEPDQNGKAMSTAPFGTGCIDLKAVVSELRKCAYNGAMTVEFYVDDDRDFAKSLQRSRAYAENLLRA